MTSKVISLRMDENIKEEAQRIAKANGISLNAVINIKLREFIREKKLNLDIDDTQEEFYESKDFVDFEGEKAEDVLKYLKKDNG